MSSPVAARAAYATLFGAIGASFPYLGPGFGGLAAGAWGLPAILADEWVPGPHL